MKRRAIVLFISLVIYTGLASTGSFFVRAQENSPKATLPTQNTVFAGNWTYRSFISNSDQSVQPNDLLFGMADVVIEETADGNLSGTLGGTGWSLTVTGKTTYAPDSINAKFQGVGTIGGEKWIYDYSGYASPQWENGVNQIPTFTGTVVRTAPHGGAPAGFVASFIAVRKGP